MENKMTKTNALTLDASYLERAGIVLDKSTNAAAKARANLTLANGGKGYIPQNAGSDRVVQIMDYVRGEIANGENALKHVCVALASVDMSEEYRNATDANGKPYTAMLPFAMDLLPTLAKSTVAGYLSVGRNIYVPAIRNRFGKSSGALLALPPSTLDALKSLLNDDDISPYAIEAIKTAGKSGNVTQRLAKGIAKTIRDAISNGTLSKLKATDIVKAAKGDANALKIVYPDNTATTRTPGGATANGGNKAAQEAANTDAYNAVKAALMGYMTLSVATNNVTITMTDAQASSLAGLLKRALTSNDENDARRVVRGLLEIIS